MAMADNRWQRLSTLCALYVAQGVPWGFMTISLISYLTAKGVSEADAGNLAAIVLVPWTFKLIWAPLVDSVTIRSMGRRRPWIIAAQFMMAVTLLGLLSMGDISSDLSLLAWMFFLHNCFASLQDVCTDALAVDVLPFDEQGSANGLMWGSKLLAKGGGAAVLASVMATWGLPLAVAVQFVLLLCIMCFPLFILERTGEKLLPWSRGAAVDAEETASIRNPLSIAWNVLRGFSLITTFTFAIFATSKLIGVGINEIVTKTLYTQELGWSYVQVSKVLGFYSIAPILLGAIGGGFLANRFGRRPIILFGFGGYAAVTIAFVMNRGMWNEDWFTTSYLMLTEGLSAAGSVGFLSMAMRITWTQAAATMFTTYMTLSNVGHVVGNWLAGPVRERLSYEQTFWLVVAANLVPLVLMPLVRPEEVDPYRYPSTETESATSSGSDAVESEPCPA